MEGKEKAPAGRNQRMEEGGSLLAAEGGGRKFDPAEGGDGMDGGMRRDGGMRGGGSDACWVQVYCGILMLTS